MSNVETLQQMLYQIHAEDIIILFDVRENERFFDDVFAYSEQNDIKVLFIHDQKNHLHRKKCAVNLYLGGD